MNRKKIALLVIVVIIGAFLRFYSLASNPPSIDWDEASLGYNAYSILKTGADEYGTKFPFTIRSFDDYKPPLYVYLTVPSIAFFGLNEFAVRFPAALFGVLAILCIYFFTKELLQGNVLVISKKIPDIDVPIITAFFLAISPWHLQFSRAAFEGNVGLFFFLLASLFFLYGLKNGKMFMLSAVCFVLSMYSYHSFRLIVPLFLVASIILFRDSLRTKKKYIIISLFIFLLFLFPIIYNFFSTTTGVGSRLSMVTIFNEPTILDKSIRFLEHDKSHQDILGQLFHNRRFIFMGNAIKGYTDHWNFDFLFLSGDSGRQHHAVDMGMVYLWDFPFILIGILFLFMKRTKYFLFLFIWFLLAPLPSSITTGTPHPVRAIAMVVPLCIFAAVGFVVAMQYFLNKKQRILGTVCAFAIVFLLLFNITYYIHQYYVHTPVEYGDFWQYGYKEVFSEAKKKENNYEKIIVTYRYDQPYVYYLFYNKINPSWYQKNWDTSKNGNVMRMHRVVGKYEFRNIDWENDRNLKNTLIIGAPEEIPAGIEIEKEIIFPNGDIAFRIVSL